MESSTQSEVGGVGVSAETGQAPWAPGAAGGRLTWRQRVVWLTLLTAFWALLAVVFAAQMALFGPFSWGQALRFTFRDWYPWMVFSPLVLWVSRRFPLEQGQLRIPLLVHLVTCLVAVAGCGVLAQAIDPGPGFGDRRFGPGPRPQAEGPPTRPGERGEGVPWTRPPGPRPERFERERGGRDGRGSVWRVVSMRANFNLPIHCVVVSLGHAFTFFQRSRERERRALDLEARLARARLQALRMQLHPHFLFNTLNAISTLVHKDPAAADETIANLSELLRLALEDPERQEVPLAKELEFIDRYLEIQTIRFGPRLRVEREIERDALAGQVPAMILQPLVENAIRHGIEPEPGPGCVKLTARRVGERLRLGVWDSGRGLPSSPPKGKRQGIGLANTRARLRELYGEGYRLELSRADGGGFLAQVELPFRREPQATNLPAS